MQRSGRIPRHRCRLSLGALLILDLLVVEAGAGRGLSPHSLDVWRTPFAAAMGTAGIEDPTVLYPSRFHVDHESRENADVLDLAPGGISPSVLLSLRESGGRVRCLVVEETSGSPVEGILVEASVGAHSAYALTGADGFAVLTGVPSGNAVLRTRPDDSRSETGAYGVRFAPGVISRNDAGIIHVENGQTTDAGEIRIPVGGRIKASVFRPEGAPWSGAPVVLRAADPGALSPRVERLADSQGRVTFGGLEPGVYRLWADARGSSALTECWDGSRDTVGSSVIVLERGELRGGITISTDRGGVIRGSVRNVETQEGYPGIEVRILSTANPGDWHAFHTDDIGFYEAVGLPAGRYWVFVPEIRRYYPDGQTLEQARIVEVAEGGEVSRIDVKGRRTTDCEMPQETAGAIQGTVRADFLLMPAATIMLWNESDTVRTVIMEDGVYTISCLVPGAYRAALLPHGSYRSQYHPKVNDPTQAGLIMVAPGDTTERIDFEPERGIEIRGGVVAASDGAALPGIPVTASLLEPPLTLTLQTDESGIFRFDHMPDGTGIPSGRWIVGSDSIAVPALRLTPAFSAGLFLERTEGGILLRLDVPETASLWNWEVEYRSPGGAGGVLCSAADHPDGTSARQYVDKDGTGATSYRLTIWILQGTRLRRIESSWVRLQAKPGRIWPNPWNGRDFLTIGSHGAMSEEAPSLIAADGRRLFRLERAGARFRVPAGESPGAGVYFLRYRTWDGKEISERLVLAP